MIYDVIASQLIAPHESILHNLCKFHRNRLSRLREKCNLHLGDNSNNHAKASPPIIDIVVMTPSDDVDSTKQPKRHVQGDHKRFDYYNTNK